MNSASYGDDYGTGSQSGYDEGYLTFEADAFGYAAPQSFSIPIAYDNITEGQDVFFVDLTDQNGNLLPGFHTCRVNIDDGTSPWHVAEYLIFKRDAICQNTSYFYDYLSGPFSLDVYGTTVIRCAAYFRVGEELPNGSTCTENCIAWSFGTGGGWGFGYNGLYSIKLVQSQYINPFFYASLIFHETVHYQQYLNNFTGDTELDAYHKQAQFVIDLYNNLPHDPQSNDPAQIALYNLFYAFTTEEGFFWHFITIDPNDPNVLTINDTQILVKINERSSIYGLSYVSPELYCGRDWQQQQIISWQDCCYLYSNGY